MEVTVSKMSVTLPVDDKKKKSKHLWAIIGDHGHTMIQVYSEDFPTPWLKLFKFTLKDDTTN